MRTRAWMLAGGLSLSTAVGCASAPASRAPAAAAGAVEIVAVAQSVRHGDDGAGAFIDRVFVEATNRDGRAHELEVTRVERLHGSCDAPGWGDARDLPVQEPRVPITLGPAEATRVAVVFEPVPCFEACDRFAFRVHVTLDGAARVVEVPVSVVRGPSAP